MKSLPAILFAGLALLLLVAPPELLSAESRSKEKHIGIVALVDGKVWRISKDNKSRELLRPNSKVFPSEEIITEAGSYVKILMIDDTIFDLAASSRFKFNKFDMKDRKNKKERKAGYKLLYGKLRSLFSVKAKEGDLKIETPDIVMGIRGTILYNVVQVNALNQSRTHLLVTEGLVEVQQVGPPNQGPPGLDQPGGPGEGVNVPAGNYLGAGIGVNNGFSQNSVQALSEAEMNMLNPGGESPNLTRDIALTGGALEEITEGKQNNQPGGRPQGPTPAGEQEEGQNEQAGPGGEPKADGQQNEKPEGDRGPENTGLNNNPIDSQSEGRFPANEAGGGRLGPEANQNGPGPEDRGPLTGFPSGNPLDQGSGDPGAALDRAPASKDPFGSIPGGDPNFGGDFSTAPVGGAPEFGRDPASGAEFPAGGQAGEFEQNRAGPEQEVRDPGTTQFQEPNAGDPRFAGPGDFGPQEGFEGGDRKPGSEPREFFDSGQRPPDGPRPGDSFQGIGDAGPGDRQEFVQPPVAGDFGPGPGGDFPPPPEGDFRDPAGTLDPYLNQNNGGTVGDFQDPNLDPNTRPDDCLATNTCNQPPPPPPPDDDANQPPPPPPGGAAGG